MNNLPYRPCVGIALFNKDGLVFAGKRIDTNAEAWQMPQGGIDKGEDLQKAAFRELKEEIGTDKADILKIMDHTTKYDLPDHLGHLWGGQYRGQEQHWIAMRFTGEDSDIDIAADDHPEFNEWRWVDLPDLLDLIVPFKRETYEQVIEAFKDL